MKKLALLVIFLSIIAISPAAYAFTSLPDGIYLEQQGAESCTSASAAMMLRARTYLSGNDTWNLITEEKVESIAWINGRGLSTSFTYNFDDNHYISVDRTEVGGFSVASLKTVLDAHPEGIVLYCRNIPHAVFVCDYEGDTFYCADPGARYWSSIPSGRIQLGNSSLSISYGSQAGILNNTTHYWYVSSYSVAPSTPTAPTVTVTQSGTDAIISWNNIGADSYEVLVQNGTATNNLYIGSTTYCSTQVGLGAGSFRVIVHAMFSNGVILGSDWVYYTISTTPPPSPDPALPDGNYIIAAAADTHFYLDIVGGDYPAAPGTNVQLYYTADGNVGAADVWKVTNNGNGYYRIAQYGQNVSLDVDNESNENGANVQVWTNNNWSAQQWAISGNANSGYRMKAQCSGKYLEYRDSNLISGTNVQQWAYDDVPAQIWQFIPYTPVTAPSVTFEPWESAYTYIGETDASIGRIVMVSDGNCSGVGMILYDSAGNQLGYAQNPAYENEKNFFKINEELGVTLKGGTTYQYQFFAVVNGTTYYDSKVSFTTSPCTHSLTHHAAVSATEYAAGNYEYWYCSKCGKYFSDAACATVTTREAVTIPKLEPVIAYVSGVECRNIEEINVAIHESDNPVVTVAAGRTIPYEPIGNNVTAIPWRQKNRVVFNKSAVLDLNGGTVCGAVVYASNLLIKDSANGLGKVTGIFALKDVIFVGGSGSKIASLTVTGGSFIPEFNVAKYLAPGYTVQSSNSYDKVVRAPVTFVLPVDLTRIEDEAFAGITNCIVRIPDGVAYVSPTAFDPSVTLVVTSGSTAANAVKNNGLY